MINKSVDICSAWIFTHFNFYILCRLHALKIDHVKHRCDCNSSFCAFWLIIVQVSFTVVNAVYWLTVTGVYMYYRYVSDVRKEQEPLLPK